MSVVTNLLRFGGRRSAGEDVYICGECGARYEVRYHSCPECGSFCFDRVEWSVEQ